MLFWLDLFSLSLSLSRTRNLNTRSYLCNVNKKPKCPHYLTTHLTASLPMYDQNDWSEASLGRKESIGGNKKSNNDHILYIKSMNVTHGIK